MEPCRDSLSKSLADSATTDGGISKLVNSHSKLPTRGVLELGMKLCCALDAVHRGCSSLHLDPSTFLSRSTHNSCYNVKLSLDFGLAQRLPARLSAMPAGMSSPPCRRRSYIYSLGATLLFAARGRSPPEDAAEAYPASGETFAALKGPRNICILAQWMWMAMHCIHTRVFVDSLGFVRSFVGSRFGSCFPVYQGGLY